jgi:hypothetical protein
MGKQVRTVLKQPFLKFIELSLFLNPAICMIRNRGYLSSISIIIYTYPESAALLLKLNFVKRS